MKNYYQILGVQKTASEDDIKGAFRKLAHKYHPDKKGGDEAKFKEVSEAYAILSDTRRRAEYDARGRAFAGGTGNGQGFGGFNTSNFEDFFREFSAQDGSASGWDLGDIFGEFFSTGGGHGRRRGRDISIDIELPFKEAIFGTERRVLISKLGICDACTGTGAKPGSKTIACSSCNGKGEVRESRNTFFGTFTSARMCPTCGGRGEVPETPCPTCRGVGVFKRQEEVHVVVPAGVQDGEMIRMPQAGEAAAGAPAGDLYIKLHVKADKHFIRDGNNLETTLSIKLTDALLGGSHRVYTLDGDEMIHIPTGITHGEIVRVKGRGIPHGRGTRGDLLVRIHIEFPKKLSKSAQDMVEKLRAEGL